jgi:hypothetical protein
MSDTIDSMDSSLSDSNEAYMDYSGEAYPDYNEAQWGEARRPMPRPVPTAPRRNAYSPPRQVTNSPVTQQQLQQALARVSAQITTNSNAIRTVDGRVRSVTAEQGRQTAALRKEVSDRRKEAETLRRDLQSTRELSALLPLVAPPGTTLGNIAPLAHLLPSDTWGGTGIGGSSSGGLLGGGSGLIALIAIASASGVFNPK